MELLHATFGDLQDQLLGTLYYLLGNFDDAYDAFQETFQRCWHRRDSMPGPDALKAWVFQIGLHVARQRRSVAWRRRRRELDDQQSLKSLLGSPPPGPGTDLRLARVRSALLQLRCEEQEVFLLRQNGQMSYREIAEVTGVPPSTVMIRMRLALGRLREAFDDGA